MNLRFLAMTSVLLISFEGLKSMHAQERGKLANLFTDNSIVDLYREVPENYVFLNFENETLSVLERNDLPEYANGCLEISGEAIYREQELKTKEKTIIFVIITSKDYSKVFQQIKFEIKSVEDDKDE